MDTDETGKGEFSLSFTQKEQKTKAKEIENRLERKRRMNFNEFVK